MGQTSVIHIHSPGTVPENSWKCQFFPIFGDLSNIYKIMLSIHKYKTLRLQSWMDCNSKNLGSIFPQIETMYFWLRSATSNIHEAIPQTRWGEGGWGGVLQTPSIPPQLFTNRWMHPRTLNIHRVCLNIHYSNLAGWIHFRFQSVQTKSGCGMNIYLICYLK